MSQEVKIDLDAAVEQMTAIEEVAKDLTAITERFEGVTGRQAPVDWTHENGAVGFANQFRQTGNGLVQVLTTLHKDMEEMYEQLHDTINDFIANDEEKQERYEKLLLQHNLKDVAGTLNVAGAAIGAMVGGSAGKTMTV